jgi:hypothetical protein
MTVKVTAILVAHQNAAAGRDADYNDWYSNIHIRDVMRLPGAIAVRRFKRDAVQMTWQGARIEPRHAYFTLYELSDLDAVIDGHLRYARTDRMLISNAGDFTDPYAYYFQPCDDSQTLPPAGAVMSARFTIERDKQEDFERWFRIEHRTALQRNGIVSAALFRIAEKQMAPGTKPDSHIGIYGVKKMQEAAGAWSAAVTGMAPRPTERGDPLFLLPFGVVALGCYVPAIDRLTAERVCNPSGADRETERLARERLGDRVMSRSNASFREPE